MTDASLPESSSALKYSTFRFYVSARFLTTLAVQMQSVAIGWQVYDITGDPEAPN